jgi:hypothetical protein
MRRLRGMPHVARGQTSDVPSQTAALPLGEFRVGRVLSRSFEILFRHFVKFVAVMPIMMVPYAVVGSSEDEIWPYLGSSRMAPVFFIVITGVLFTCLDTVAQAIPLYGGLQAMKGRPFRIGEMFLYGLAPCLRIFGMSICYAAAIVVGLVMLIIPAGIFLAMFAVSLPACIVEGLGPVRSLRRSAELTNGHLGKVFGLVLLVEIVDTFGAEFLHGPTSVVLGVSAAAILGFAWTGLAVAYSAILTAVMYHDLRVLKEGPDIDRVVAVFD